MRSPWRQTRILVSAVLLPLVWILVASVGAAFGQSSDCNSNGIPDLEDVQSTYDYQLAPFFRIPGYTEEILLHDVDGDGVTDTVGLGESAIYVNNGQAQAITTFIGPSARQFRIAELNGDNIPDVVIADGLGSVKVYFGVGDGTFTFSQLIILPGQAFDLTIADFNGDGSNDLAVTVRSANLVQVHLGNFAGLLFAPATYSVGLAGPVVASDVDNDGDQDLIVVSDATDSLVVLTNSGATFTAGLSLPMGVQPRSLAVADFNSDGREDIAALIDATGSGSALVTAHNLPTQWQVNAPLPIDDPIDLAIAPIAGSAAPDWIVVDRYGVQVLENDGSGGVAAVRHYSVGCDGVDLVTGDRDGDGLTDILVGTEEDRVFLLRGADGPDVWTPAFPRPNLSAPSAVLAGDLNADGLDDLVTVEGSSATVWLGVGSGRFLLASTLPVVGGSTPLLSDMNADGALDLCIWNFNSLAIEVYTNDGSGALAFAWASAQVSPPDALRTANANGDVWPDLVSDGAVWLNAAGASFAAPQPLPFAATELAVVDVEGDGLDEVVTTDGFNPWIFDDLGATPTAVQLFPQHSSTPVTGVRFGQIDGRGGLDLLLDLNGLLLLSQGSQFLLRFGGLAPRGQLLDLDADGFDEILELKQSSFAIHEFVDPVGPALDYSSSMTNLFSCAPQLAAVGHFDTDAIADIVVFLQGGRAAVLRGQGSLAVSADCNWNGTPDECELPTGDSDGNGVLDDCETPVTTQDFVRGDCLVDGHVNLADAIFALAYLFSTSAPTPPCLEACDANADGALNLADAVHLLTYLFPTASPPPPLSAPFPQCGPGGSFSFGPLVITTNCSDYSLCP